MEIAFKEDYTFYYHIVLTGIIYIQLSLITICIVMRYKVMTSVDQTDYFFLKDHPEISPSGLLQKALNDYRNLINGHKQILKGNDSDEHPHKQEVHA